MMVAVVAMLVVLVGCGHNQQTVRKNDIAFQSSEPEVDLTIPWQGSVPYVLRNPLLVKQRVIPFEGTAPVYERNGWVNRPAMAKPIEVPRGYGPGKEGMVVIWLPPYFQGKILAQAMNFWGYGPANVQGISVGRDNQSRRFIAQNATRTKIYCAGYKVLRSEMAGPGSGPLNLRYRVDATWIGRAIVTTVADIVNDLANGQGRERR